MTSSMADGVPARDDINALLVALELPVLSVDAYGEALSTTSARIALSNLSRNLMRRQAGSLIDRRWAGTRRYFLALAGVDPRNEDQRRDFARGWTSPSNSWINSRRLDPRTTAR